VDATDLHARTGGNPLFISESIQLLADGSRLRVPLRSVQEVIRERLAPLPRACRDALEVAAVLGREFEYPPLAAALRTSPEGAVAVLDPAVTARLVAPAGSRAGSYRFAHTLIRDAVEDQLAPSRRTDLHARAFAALRDTGWGQASDLAYHAVRARPRVGDEVATAAARSAAEAADRLLAFADAAEWWRTAIALARRPDGLDTDLELRLGRSLLLAGRVDQARSHFETGLVTLRCMRALANAAAGQHADATDEIEALAADGFAALPRDSLYLASLAILAEAAVTCQAADLARLILAALTPYRSRNLIQGVPVGWGAADWYIARLQWLTGRHGDASRSAATARRLHRRWGAEGLGDPLASLGRDPASAPLSRRESEVIGLLASGRENAEMAAALGVSVHTIERHVANIFLKIGVRNRAEATAWAHRRGIAG